MPQSLRDCGSCCGRTRGARAWQRLRADHNVRCPRHVSQSSAALGVCQMSRLLPAFLGTLLCCATASQAADPRSVGEAVVIKNQVTAAEAQKDKRRLAKGDAVREQELLEAQAVSHGE